MPTASPLIKPLIKLAKLNKDVAVMWLYGSRAQHTANPQSDYDLAIAFQTFPQDPVDRRLRPEILAIEWATELGVATEFISIIDINLAPIPLAWEVTSTNKAIYVRDELRCLHEEMRISSMYELDVLYYRNQHES